MIILIRVSELSRQIGDEQAQQVKFVVVRVGPTDLCCSSACGDSSRSPETTHGVSASSPGTEWNVAGDTVFALMIISALKPDRKLGVVLL